MWFYQYFLSTNSAFCILQRNESLNLVKSLQFFGPASTRSYFSKISLIFCLKLGDYKVKKVTGLGFWKIFLIWRYLQKGLQISPKSDTLIFFSKTARTIFLVFHLKLVLNRTFNLIETYISEKFAIWRYLTSKSSKNSPNWGFWLFSQLCISSPWFYT